MLVIPEHAFADLFARRVVLNLYIACFFPPAALALIVYGMANIDTLLKLVPNLPPVRGGFLQVTPGLFAGFAFVQLLLVTFWTFLAGPRLIVRDLKNDALPLYFSKALRRSDYVIGKWLVLVALLSSLSWIPLLLVVGLQVSLVGPEWRRQHGWVAGAILLLFGCAIPVLTAIVTSLSAYVRREAFAHAAFVGVLLVTYKIAILLWAITDWPLALAISPMAMLHRVYGWAFRTPDAFGRDLHVAVAFVVLAAWVAGGATLLLRKIRPVEVIR
jgi:hypothetical protein